MNHAPAAEPGPPSPDPAEAIARLARASVLVIGDAMLDRYVHGTVTRMISGTTPGAIPGMIPGAIPGTPGTPVLTEERELALPGGAANVVRYLTGLGAAVAFISVVGDDPSGSDLTGLVGGQPNVEPWLLVEGGRTTTVKTRYLADGRHLLRADREQTTPIPERLAERVLRIARDAMAATSLTVLSDYGKGVLADGLAARLIAAARESGRPVIAAPPRGASDAELAAYAGADALVLCAAERAAEGGSSGTDAGDGFATDAGNGSGVAPGIAARTGAGGASEAGAARAAGLRVALGVGAVLLADASWLSLATGEGGWTVGLPAASAGALADPLVAILAAALAVRIDPPVALRLAGLAGRIVAAKGATAVVRPDELLAALGATAGEAVPAGG